MRVVILYHDSCVGYYVRVARDRDESKEINKELSTGFSLKFKFQVQFDPSKIPVMHYSKSNSRQRK